MIFISVSYVARKERYSESNERKFRLKTSLTKSDLSS